ncbi:CLUMA_CG003172, isoform A [Clunio marinus]|uniref:CLUMA_CG003172, isoform A n=1 Tax=Clunio marinus TaxID=568069 RepID=A0A1J1HMZ5_9DIPT|nr:CLUMA_CG003172, isoform A [Clunio marinus]
MDYILLPNASQQWTEKREEEATTLSFYAWVEDKFILITPPPVMALKQGKEEIEEMCLPTGVIFMWKNVNTLSINKMCGMLKI